MGNYNDVLLEQLADQGDGFYAYVNDLAEARRLFTEDLTGTIQSVALDAKVQVEFDPEVVASYRLIGYENRAIADEDFRDPTGRRRGDRGRSFGDRALRALPARRVLARRRAGDGPPALDRARGVTRVVAGPGDHDRRPCRRASGRPPRPCGSMPSSRRPRRSCAARTGLVSRTCATSSMSSARTASLPPTDQVHDFVDLLERMADLRD